jgi:cytochrome c oxidase assembly protein subunit 15
VLVVSPDRYRRIALAALVALGVIVVSGAAVRLTKSGLGCTDWPRCEQGRLAPEWTFHGWVEFGNRLFSGIVSLSVGAAVLAARWRRPYRSDLQRWGWGLVVGVLAQIVLGGVTVLVDLHPVFVIAHFLLSMVLLANAVVLLDRAGHEGPLLGGGPLRLHSWVVVGLASAVLLAGTVVTGTGPHGGDSRAERLALDLTWVTRIHSSLVWLFVATLALLAVRAARSGDEAVLGRARLLLVAAVVQGGIGYLQYALEVPAGLVVLHVLGAVAVWSGALWLHLGVLRSGLLAD